MSDVTPPTLEERIAALEAVEAIKRLKYRYLRACDRKEPEVFRDCFVASGAVLDYGEKIGQFRDADGIRAVFEAIALKKVDGKHVVFDMHHAVHPDIALTSSTTAEGEWSLRFRQVNTERGTETVGAVEYSDSYEVEDGQWRIRRCEVRELWTMTTTLPEGTRVRGELA
ncbi:MAG: nuclear transport factor 2 family protein [Streptomyces albidoflavus]